jgi:GNAT superfamily N-acetyltransferase
MIRLATAADLPCLREVELSASTRFDGTHAAWANDGETLAAEILDAACRRGQLWIAADADDRPTGFLCASDMDGELFVNELDVAREHQGRGHGRALLDAAAAYAKASGYPAVVLTTDRTLSWNAPFYARYGFRLLDEAELSPGLAARLAGEAAAGHPPETRCAMRLPVR